MTDYRMKLIRYGLDDTDYDPRAFVMCYPQLCTNDELINTLLHGHLPKSEARIIVEEIKHRLDSCYEH